jgi:hypothetical protein
MQPRSANRSNIKPMSSSSAVKKAMGLENKAVRIGAMTTQKLTSTPQQKGTPQQRRRGSAMGSSPASDLQIMRMKLSALKPGVRSSEEDQKRGVNSARSETSRLRACLARKEACLADAAKWAAALGKAGLEQALAPSASEALVQLMLTLSRDASPADRAELTSLVSKLSVEPTSIGVDHPDASGLFSLSPVKAVDESIVEEVPMPDSDVHIMAMSPVKAVDESIVEEVPMPDSDAPFMAMSPVKQMVNESIVEEVPMPDDGFPYILHEKNGGNPEDTFVEEVAMPLHDHGAQDCGNIMIMDELYLGGDDDDNDAYFHMKSRGRSPQKRKRASMGDGSNRESRRRSLRVAKRQSIGSCSRKRDDGGTDIDIFGLHEVPKGDQGAGPSKQGSHLGAAESWHVRSSPRRSSLTAPLSNASAQRTTQTKTLPSSPIRSAESHAPNIAVRTSPRRASSPPPILQVRGAVNAPEEPLKISSVRNSPRRASSPPRPQAAVAKKGRRLLTGRASLLAPPPASELEIKFAAVQSVTGNPPDDVPDLTPQPLIGKASISAEAIQSLAETWFGTERVRGGGIAPMVLSAAQLLTEAELGPVACKSESGNSVGQILLPLHGALVDAEICALSQLPAGGSSRAVRFRSYDFSSVEMPSDSQPQSVRPAELTAAALTEVMNAESLVRDEISQGTTVLGLRIFIRALKTIACSPKSDLSNTIQLSLSMSGTTAARSHIAGAANFYLSELCSFTGSESKGSIASLEHSPVRQRLVILLSSLIRFHIRRLLNPPPLGVSVPTGLSAMDSARAAEIRLVRSKAWTLFQMAVPDKYPLAMLSTSGDSFAGITEGVTSSVLGHALRVLSNHAHKKEEDMAAIRECEVFTDATVSAAGVGDAVKHFLRIADVLGASNARTFVRELLSWPGLEEAVQEGGGWTVVEQLAQSLQRFAVLPAEDSHLAMLSNIRELRGHLDDQDYWNFSTRAKAAAEKLSPWITILCSGNKPSTDQVEAIDAVRQAMRSSLFPYIECPSKEDALEMGIAAWLALPAKTG